MVLVTNCIFIIVILIKVSAKRSVQIKCGLLVLVSTLRLSYGSEFTFSVFSSVLKAINLTRRRDKFAHIVSVSKANVSRSLILLNHAGFLFYRWNLGASWSIKRYTDSWQR